MLFEIGSQWVGSQKPKFVVGSQKPKFTTKGTKNTKET